MNKVIEDLQTRIAVEAVKHIDVAAMAKKMAKKIEAQMIAGLDDCLDNHLDMGYWISEELQDETSTIGKAYQKSLKKIAAQMVAAISTGAKS